MKTKSINDLKNDFSKACKSINVEEEIVITYGRKIEINALRLSKKNKKPQRKLGILKGKTTAVFVGGHNTTEEEFGL